MSHAWGFPPDGPTDAEVLSGRMFVWYESDVGRVVFYDFDNDEGLSLDLHEWRTAVAWWGGLDEAKSTLTPPRPSQA